MRHLVFLLLLVLPGLLLAQADEEEDVWAPLRPVIGEWAGTGSGPGGESKIEAGYQFALGDNYIEAWHRSVFEPSEMNPEGEVHEDRGFISYDSGRGRLVFRQFHVEGFVNQYVLDSLSADGSTMYFVSEDIENAPPGTMAKLEVIIRGESELETSFHVAWPGSDFQCFSNNKLKRK
jgi:hypothetical protein